MASLIIFMHSTCLCLSPLGILALTVRQFTRKNNSGGRETDSDVEINLSILEKGDSKTQIFLQPADKTPSSDEILHSSSMVSSSDLSSKVCQHEPFE